MFFVAVLIIGISCAMTDDLCYFKLSSGESIDLHEVPVLGVDLNICYNNDHRLEFHLCKSLGVDQCKSKETEPPGNACDIDDIGNAYYWVGGFTEWTKSSYGDVTSSFSMLYHGKVQPDGTTRDLNVRMICNPDVKDNPLVSCTGVNFDGQLHYTYYVEVSTKYACPKKSNAAAVVIPILVVLCCCCCCCVVLTWFVIGLAAIGGILVTASLTGTGVTGIFLARRGGYATLDDTAGGGGGVGGTENSYEDLDVPSEMKQE